MIRRTIGKRNAKRKREPRPPQQKTRRQIAHAQHEAEWQKNRLQRPKRDWYKERITADSPRKPVDGRRLAEDLRRIHSLTGDPIFGHAREVLVAYGLAAGPPLASAKRVWRSLPPHYHSDLEELLESEERQAKKEGRRFSLREAAEEAVASCGVHGASFDSAVDEVRKRYAQARRAGLSMYPRTISGATGRSVKVLADYRDSTWRRPQPDQNGLLPDDRDTRNALYRGEITVRFLGKK